MTNKVAPEKRRSTKLNTKKSVEDLRINYATLLKVTLILFKLLFALFLVLNLFGPIVIYAWPKIMSHMIFQAFIHIPFKNLSNPTDFGLEQTYAFKLKHDDVDLGAWHILPENASIESSKTTDEHFKKNLKPLTEQQASQIADESNPKVVLYLHGNTNDRSTGHRVYLYLLLRSLGYHVVAVDYRGYGDSTGEPTEDDVVKDSLFTYEYIRDVAAHANIYIWGHSLGTGIASRLARILSEIGKPAQGVILEAPFFNIVEEVEWHPFTLAWPYNPLFYTAIENALASLNLQFRSDIHITKIDSKIMILHAEDDLIIPIYQAEKLYDVANKNGISKNVTFHKISGEYGCGHNNIYWSPNIDELLKTFIV